MRLGKWMLVMGIISIALTGCRHSGEDIELRRIITAIGIDAASGGRLQLTLKSPRLGGTQTENQKEENDKPVTLTAAANGVAAALDQIQTEEEHSLFIGQSKVILFGQDFARRGLHPVMDYLERIPVLPPTAYVAVVKTSAADVFSIPFRSPEKYDLEFRHFFAKRKLQVPVYRSWKLFQTIYDPLKDPFLPFIEPTEDRQSIRIIGLAIFHGDRMAGDLTMDEAKILGFIMNEPVENNYSFPLKGKSNTNAQLTLASNRIKISGTETSPVYTFKLRFNAQIDELGRYETPVKLQDKRVLSREMERILYKRTMDLLHKLKTLKCDPLQLGDRLRIARNNHLTEKEWHNIYPSVRFKVKIQVNVERFGLLQ